MSRRTRQSNRRRTPGGFKGIVQLAWPSTLSTLLFSIMQIWGIWVVRPLGVEGIAALTTGMRLTFAAQALIFAVSVAAGAQIARNWGMGNQREASRVIWTALALGVLVSSFVSCAFWLFDVTFSAFFFNASEERAIEMSASYLRYSAFWFWAIASHVIISQAMRAAGIVILPLIASGITAAACIPLTYGLVYGYDSLLLPELGVAGVAVASGFSMALGSVAMLIAWLGGKTIIPPVRMPALFSYRMRRLVQLAIPASGEQAAIQGGILLFTLIIARYGVAAYSAYGIGVQILSISFLFGFGFSVAASTLVGQALGAGDPVEARREGIRAASLAVLFMTILGGLLVLGRHDISAALAPSAEAAHNTALFILFLGSMQPFMALEFSLSGALRGSGDTRSPFLITLIGIVVVRQSWAVIALFLGAPIAWIYAALLGDYLIKSSLYVWRYHTTIGVSRQKWASSQSD